MRWLMFLAILTLSTTPAGAQATLSDPDRAAIRNVIEGQLAAFQNDDGQAAFGFASPSIRAMFGDSETFMTMVRKGYQPVYRPREVEFRDLAPVAGDAGSNGCSWWARTGCRSWPATPWNASPTALGVSPAACSSRCPTRRPEPLQAPAMILWRAAPMALATLLRRELSSSSSGASSADARLRRSSPSPTSSRWPSRRAGRPAERR